MRHGERSSGGTSVQNCTDAAARRAVRSTTCWFSPPSALLILSFVAVMRRRTAGAEPDLGWVSERWLAENRADSTRPSL